MRERREFLDDGGFFALDFNLDDRIGGFLQIGLDLLDPVRDPPGTHVFLDHSVHPSL
jgi:hypothetical protein